MSENKNSIESIYNNEKTENIKIDNITIGINKKVFIINEIGGPLIMVILIKR